MSYFGEISRGEEPGRAVWVPFLETLAAQVEGCDLSAIISDATLWANSLPRIAKLVDARVIAVGFIDGLGVDSFAAKPEEPWKHTPLEALLECTRRLAETVRPDRELVVAMPGPAGICKSLGKPMERAVLEEMKPALVKLLEIICECRPDMVVINEPEDAGTQLACADYRRMCNTLKNVTEYFGVALGLRVSAYGDAEQMIGELRTLRLDHLMIRRAGESANSTPGLVAAGEGQGWRSVGISVASDEAVCSLPQKGTGYYWCSETQEQDLEQARRTGCTLAAGNQGQ